MPSSIRRQRERTIVDQNEPALTELHKLTLQNLGQRIELAQLRAQVAQVEFDKARTEIAALVQSLQVQGYDLDLQALTYIRKPESPGAGKERAA
jgi:hypothetical protein